ncbi:dihydroxyacetone kinase-like protein [Kribbella orskensis]|uniref:Dihydroxyacetone kinase-like protein n=1 Tax=Kribbella orskensis TaxID=2512216 RepID=A0ABY2BI20_9ACTN|nr:MULTISPECIES: dihydroxyacetone kinase subunit DhaL [Kribbella]TCN36916.1 dihydroxyacetone kinase-like protein [Kribbella sp. VKM Ac-2500]TCO18340.1 dihydroxyacetone kinase-like protein [Kribbella orskensis]
MGEQKTVEDFANWLRDLAVTLHENAAYLTELDSAIGDADHGTNMDRGFTAIVAVLDETTFESVDELLKKAGMTLVSKVGGASGPLYGTFFLRFGTALAGKEITPASVGEALKAGIGGILARGKPELGDKTMYDAWAPALEAYDGAVAGGSDLGGALAAAAEAAAKGRDATTPLVARKGRASYLGERSAGHQDPGATSTTLLLESAARTLA